MINLVQELNATKNLTLMTKSFNETFLTWPSFFLEASKFLFKSSRNLCKDKERTYQ